ncbi:hypothetical protein SAMN05421780_10413 [Flexibacter flexilis DSM 6793]|uniref:Uncharacterized protein n=1 Tax=Flexibacter flexilis DSM 6793 TaxID=927664 RepID=A0A1I1HLB3_9BACT|nr:hypothetical protein [Flexibacter flexilis]SFC24867.1 hypothetical protein SAMN05421780_10413 [Flexibacter flexilis DSM 6793]
MGYGAYMSIQNDQANPIKTYVIDVNCMYDQGEDGSNLSLFNDVEIKTATSLPSSGNGQYIEAKGSGSCFFSNSAFSIKIEDATNNVIIGQVDFTDTGNDWGYKNTNEDVVDVYVNNSGDQAVIKITVENT